MYITFCNVAANTYRCPLKLVAKALLLKPRHLVCLLVYHRAFIKSSTKMKLIISEKNLFYS